MKRKTTKEILAESFFELAENKNVDKITIKDIVNNCGYSTATFYRHFKDKYDLIAWDEAVRTSRIMDQIGIDGYVWKDTLLDGAFYFNQRKEYLANLFLHTSGHDSYIRYWTELNCSVLKAYLEKIIGNPLDEQLEMYIRLYVTGCVYLTCEWVLGKYTCTPEELARIYENSIPMPLREYLVKNENN